MKFSSLLTSAALLGALSLTLPAASRAQDQNTAATDPVGVTTSTLPANADSAIALPLTRAVQYNGTIQSVAGSTITVVGTPGWTANQFKYVAGTQSNTFYAIIGPDPAQFTGTVSATLGSTLVTGTGTAFTTQVAVGDEIFINGKVGSVAAVTSNTALTLVSAYIGSTVTNYLGYYDHSPKEGCYYTVTANGTNTLTVDLNGDTLATLAAQPGSTMVSLIPYWTLGTAFPATDANISFTPTTSTTTPATEILLPDLAGTGINLPPKTAYYFYNGHWREASDTTGVSHDDDLLLPSTYLTVSNTAAATTLTPAGSVYTNRLTIPLDSTPTGPQDNAVALLRPAAVALNDLGLIASHAFTPGTSAQQPGDLLITAATGSTPATTYYYLNGAWRLSGGNATVDEGTAMIPFGIGLTIRKVAAAADTTVFWQNTRNF